ncbi:purine-nucleoside phosphorylase [Sansalvadorimonas sp. 2012CJ34-2]|uniref:Purine nucleoside phosphorylase DeoD-type n=1 Tax=Parendozoicomonas callyspongiae TaxID=2942213 RepID=A0ABT0PL49_9GAMM|nr:purine-nucleoside phosphorylase [Sansalvadorimonas sp. 2012CJ34-2]MCL6272109.1 purine-nucleoside phosphorylase [Sansalvadorimonas sp. 2012CJ34-2]
MPTPHINAAPGDFASVVIMPDDPVRARFIAEHYLESAREVTSVRNMLGFTGQYEGRDVSVVGSGIGIPSISIYARELYVEYGVEAIIRVGRCSAIHQDVAVRDLILAIGACTSSGVNRQRFAGCDFAATCDYDLLCSASRLAYEKKIRLRAGNVCSVDAHLENESALNRAMERMGILGTEMEAAGLYGVAAECGRKALAFSVAFRHLKTGDAILEEDQEKSTRNMISLAMRTATSYSRK